MTQSNQKTLEEMIRDLPPESLNQLENFAAFLQRQQSHRKRQKPSFSWAGCLKDYEPSKSSVDIQHEINDLRIKDQ